MLDFVDGTTEWSDACKVALEERLSNNQFVAVIKDCTQDDLSPSIDLFDTSTADDVNMNKYFVQKGFVKSLGASSDPNIVKLTTAVDANSSSANSACFPEYLPAALPYERRFIATGVHIDADANIYLHIMDDYKEKDDQLRNIMMEINSNTESYDTHPKTTAELRIGQACIGKFSQDDYWYRVKILEILSLKDVKVEFVDFGNSEETSVGALFMAPKYLNVPSQCISVQLEGITPKLNESGYSEECIEYLNKQIVSENVMVDLQQNVTQTPPYKATIHNKDEVDIADLLLTLDLAIRQTDRPRPADANLFDEKEFILDLTPSLTPEAVHHSEYLWYSEQQLPPIGVRFDVQVTQVNDPHLVFIQRNPPMDGEELFASDANDETADNAYAEIDRLYEITDVLNSEEFLNDDSLRLPDPIVGMACVGRYSEDCLHYRARIERVNEENKTADVVFVDYGNSETVPIESLTAIKPDLVLLPMQSSQVRIAGVVTKDDADIWTLEQRKQFFEIVANKRMIAQIVGYTETHPFIHLYDRCLVEDCETGETIDTLIGQILKEKNIADFKLDEQQLAIVS